MRTVAVINMKGGVGKTTTAVHLAAGWARTGLRVLLVDADPQGNVGHVLDVRARATIRELMMGEASLEDTVVHDIRPGLDVVTARPSAFALDTQLAGVLQRETILARRLRALTGYDAVVVDTSPSMNLLAYNALLFVNEILVPVGMDALAVLGARQTLDGVAEIRALWPDRPLGIAAIVPTAVRPHTHATRAALAALQADASMRADVFGPGIRQCIDLTYAAAAHQTIWEYAPSSQAAHDYAQLLAFVDRGRGAEDGPVHAKGKEVEAVV
jgi:chromosome partitioning protein